MAQDLKLEPNLISANSASCNIHCHVDEAPSTAIITHGVQKMHYISLVDDKVLEMKKQTVPQFSVEI